MGKVWGVINLNILVVGGGAREHAICDAVCHSKGGIRLYSIMNNLNPGIKRLSKDYLQVKETNVSQVVEYAKEKEIDLVIAVSYTHLTLPTN